MTRESFVPFSVLGYVRVSTENQLENYSIEEQTQRIRSYCEAKGWNLIKIYTDGGYSGGNTNRPALQEMLSCLPASGADAVVVYKLDRLSRSQKDTLTLIEDRFLANGVDFVSINENFDTSSPFGRATIGMLSVFAQLEKDQIVERFTMGRIGRGKAGYFHGGGTPPTGYDYIGGELVVNEYQAVQVREVFRRFLSGESVNAVARNMAEGYGGTWSSAKVCNILRNSVYIGKVKYAGVEYDGRHQPIIPEEQFFSAGQLLASPEREMKKTTAQKTPFRAGYLLSSLVYCARCGARYSAVHGRYRCYSRSKTNKKFIEDPNCKNDNWPIDDLDALVVRYIRRLAASPENLNSILQTVSEKEIPVDTAAIARKIRDVESQMSRLIDLYQVGTVPIGVLSERIHQLKLEKDVLSSELAAVPSVSSEERRETFLDRLRRFVEHFDDAPLETQRLLVSSVVSRVIVDGEDVEIEWRIEGVIIQN